eukprot:scaffold7498_cov258-Pinguiococcus_pyrenoidosus.AAC.1
MMSWNAAFPERPRRPRRPLTLCRKVVGIIALEPQERWQERQPNRHWPRIGARIGVSRPQLDRHHLAAAGTHRPLPTVPPKSSELVSIAALESGHVALAVVRVDVLVLAEANPGEHRSGAKQQGGVDDERFGEDVEQLAAEHLRGANGVATVVHDDQDVLRSGQRNDRPRNADRCFLKAAGTCSTRDLRQHLHQSFCRRQN